MSADNRMEFQVELDYLLTFQIILRLPTSSTQSKNFQPLPRLEHTDGSSSSFPRNSAVFRDLMPCRANARHHAGHGPTVCDRRRQDGVDQKSGYRPAGVRNRGGRPRKTGIVHPACAVASSRRLQGAFTSGLRGTFYHGIADKFDESKLEPRPAGSFFTEPKGVRHFGMTKDEGTILYFVGIGPSSTDNIEK
jgi:hypothetical protein